MRTRFNDDRHPIITTTLTTHAERQAQRRGIAYRTLDLILTHADGSRGLPGHARGLWISRRRRDQLVRQGLAAGDVDRAAGVRLVIKDDHVLTIEHCTSRRAFR